MAETIKRGLGLVALSLGLFVLGWIAYNLFFPTAEFQRSYSNALQIIAPIVMVWVGARWLFGSGPGLERQNIDFDAPELVDAVKRARATLPSFIERVRTNIDGAYVKFPFETDQGATEHVWGYVHHYDNGVFNVSMVNAPVYQDGEFETRRDVAETDVEDWQIMHPDDTIEGGYSIRGAFQYLERKGVPMNRTLRRQRAQLRP